MHRCLILAAVVCSGCYRPTFGDCELLCSGIQCPADLVCEQGVCRTSAGLPACTTIVGEAGTEAGLPGDLDGDTIADGDDNCPMTRNTNQSNEDRDAFGDVCDPCPPLGTAVENFDSDGDGVGDGCDINPNPNQPNQIVLFEGFEAGAPSTPGVMMNPGCWSFASGGATATASGIGAAICRLVFPRSIPPSHLNYVMSSRTTITAQNTATIRRTGLIDDADSSGTMSSGAVCAFGRDTNIDRLSILNSNGGADLMGTDAMNVVGPPVITRFTRGPTRDDYRCAAPGSAPFDVAVTAPFPAVAVPHLGLYVRAVDSTTDWLMVVSGP